MKIGVLSDTHGYAGVMEWAIETFRRHDVEAVIHCGDIHRASHAELLLEEFGRLLIAAGNCDYYARDKLAQLAECDPRMTYGEDFAATQFDGVWIAVTHGHHRGLLEDLAGGGEYRYVCYGHSHRRDNRRYGDTRVINPGSPAESRRGPESVAILDTTEDTVEFVDYLRR
ncbi:MAG: YfcE family phosphodiesterase [Phycisphaerales bacterium]|jgi:uncharacterized protein|nr:YfcE family phosphodiesterase [Phycisphaerales bacterium]MBT7096459.1 YfcE family phosphodiesterase [Candidatus Poribacteria bacterium]